jgi:hypothetical protein
MDTFMFLITVAILDVTAKFVLIRFSGFRGDYFMQKDDNN